MRVLMDPTALPAPTPPSSGEPWGPQGATPRPSTSSSQFNHPKAPGITHPGGRCQLSSSPPPLLCPQLSCFGMASNVVLSPKPTVGACPVPATPSQPEPHGDPTMLRLHSRGKAGYGTLGAQGTSPSRAAPGRALAVKSPHCIPQFSHGQHQQHSPLV